MNMHLKKAILSFKQRVENTGVVCKDEILTLEGALGENLFTSSLKINSFSSISSNMNVPEVLDIVNRKIETDKIDLDRVTTLKDTIRIVLHVNHRLKTLSRYISNLGKRMPGDTIERIYRSEHRNTFMDDKGEINLEPSDVLTDYMGPRTLLLNTNLLSGFSGITSDRVASIIKPLIPMEFNNAYSSNWFDYKSFGVAMLLNNNEVFKYLTEGKFTHIEVNAKSYLDIIINHQDVIKDINECIEHGEYFCSNVIANNYWYNNNDLERKFTRYTNFAEKFEDDKLTIPTFLALNKLLP